MDQIYIDMAVGALSGAIYGGANYLKKRQQGEAFDVPKFGGSVIIGAGVGVGVANLGLMVGENTVSDALVMAATMGFTGIIENVLRAMFRAIKGQ